MPTVEFNSDKAAIDYIRKRGYASYSSMKNVRDCVVPSFVSSAAYDFGKELHSRDLEGKRLKTFSKEDEAKLKAMLKVLAESKVVQRLKDGAKFEQEFKQLLYGVTVLGYIDIDGADAVSDYKTCWHDNVKRFTSEMDFLQAALYTTVRKKRDFYYIGICKEPPHALMIFNVQQYPEHLKLAQIELKNLLTYIKYKLVGKLSESITYKVWLNR